MKEQADSRDTKHSWHRKLYVPLGFMLLGMGIAFAALGFPSLPNPPDKAIETSGSVQLTRVTPIEDTNPRREIAELDFAKYVGQEEAVYETGDFIPAEFGFPDYEAGKIAYVNRTVDSCGDFGNQRLRFMAFGTKDGNWLAIGSGAILGTAFMDKPEIVSGSGSDSAISIRTVDDDCGIGGAVNYYTEIIKKEGAVFGNSTNGAISTNLFLSGSMVYAGNGTFLTLYRLSDLNNTKESAVDGCKKFKVSAYDIFEKKRAELLTTYYYDIDSGNDATDIANGDDCLIPANWDRAMVFVISDAIFSSNPLFAISSRKREKDELPEIQKPYQQTVSPRFKVSGYPARSAPALSISVNPDQIYVNPYTKSDGTRVSGHYRTKPNKTKNDNIGCAYSLSKCD